MKWSDVAKVSFAIACLAASAAILVHYFSRASIHPDDRPEGYYYTCAQCGHEFHHSAVELRKVVRSGPIRCPQCASDDARFAYRCTACGLNMPPVGHGSRPPTCPHCGAATFDSREIPASQRR